ncbi:type II toxin-antitoxin system VapC family toxin [Chloroflexota bacterium]
MPVIDASVYITLMNEHEDAHTSSWAWFEQAQTTQEPVVAPAILLPEVAAALSRGIGDSALAHRVVQQLRHSEVIELIPVTLTIAGQAATIAANYRIRGCDAVYIALADHRGDSLITLDRQQLGRGAAIVAVREP